MESRGGTGSAGTAATEAPAHGSTALDVELSPVSLGRREVDAYYHGFSNRTLWPLLHGLVEQPVFDRRWWDAYRAVNERFAAADDPAAPRFRWVHDYHLMLLPELLRAPRSAAGAIGFFLHVPFPPPEVFARLPWREQVLDGMLGADVVSFHTEQLPRQLPADVPRLLVDDVVVDGDARRTRRRPRRCGRTSTRSRSTRDDFARERDAAGRRAGARRLQRAVRGAPRPARRRPPRLHEGHPRAAARDRAAARAAARSPARARVRPDRRPEPRRDPRVPRAARGGRAARRPDQRPLHRAGPRRARPLPLPRRHARPPARLLPARRRLPRDAAPGRDEPRRQGVRRRPGGDRRAPACSS